MGEQSQLTLDEEKEVVSLKQRLLIILCWVISMFFSFPPLCLILPIIIYSKGEPNAFLKNHAKACINTTISFIIYLIVSVVILFMGSIISIFIPPLLYVFGSMTLAVVTWYSLVVLIEIVSASLGRTYQPRMTFHWLKK